MGDLIDLTEHRLFEVRDELEYLYRNCTFIKKDFEFPKCYGFEEDECSFCEVPEFYSEVKKMLTKFQCTGKLE
jgi:translation elongation factor EF-1alpha